jgi:uncharacterized membrane protein YphA (DoxX/SURF4 family)
MIASLFRRSFTAFHFILGLGIFWLSAQTVAWAVRNPKHPNPHIIALAAAEAIGALLFLLPLTLRVGAALLLLTIGTAIAVHAFAGEWRIDLLIYAAGVWLVAAHNSRESVPAS